jgi:hypothetical protein
LDQRVGAFVVQPMHPRDDGERRDEHAPGRLCERPSPCRAQLEDREALDGRVVRPALGRELLHPGVLDA